MSFIQKLMMWLGIFVTGIVLIGIALVSFSFYTTSGMVDTIQAQLTELRKGNVITAYSYTAQAFQKATSVDAFRKFLDQYPALRINEDAYFTDRELNGDNVGMVKGTLNAKDGTSISVEYRMVKENDKWKILGIQIVPADAGVRVAEQNNNAPKPDSSKPVLLGTNVNPTPPAPTPTPTPAPGPTPTVTPIAPTPAAPQPPQPPQPPTPTEPVKPLVNEGVVLPNNYDDPNKYYSIHYPADWSYEKERNGTMVFGGNKGTPAYFSTVSIKIIPSRQNGGKYEDVESLLNSFKKHIASSAQDVNFISDDPIDLPENTIHEKMPGRVYVASYSYAGQHYKQMQFFFLGDDGDTFYTFAYTSTLDRYQLDYPTAQAMFATWNITKESND